MTNQVIDLPVGFKFTPNKTDLTLDEFAAHALTGLIARYDADALIGQQHAERWAKVAYLIAAQMIKERENHERH